MTNIEVALVNLGEATATELHKNNDTQGVKNLKQDGEYKQLEYLLITGIHIRTGVEVKRLDSVYLPATTAPLKDNETAIIGTAVKFARADHRHPKTIATETIIGQLAIATEIESLEETLDNKIITPIIK